MRRLRKGDKILITKTGAVETVSHYDKEKINFWTDESSLSYTNTDGRWQLLAFYNSIPEQSYVTVHSVQTNSIIHLFKNGYVVTYLKDTQRVVIKLGDKFNVISVDCRDLDKYLEMLNRIGYEKTN